MDAGTYAAVLAGPQHHSLVVRWVPGQGEGGAVQFGLILPRGRRFALLSAPARHSARSRTRGERLRPGWKASFTFRISGPPQTLPLLGVGRGSHGPLLLSTRRGNFGLWVVAFAGLAAWQQVARIPLHHRHRALPNAFGGPIRASTPLTSCTCSLFHGSKNFSF